MGTNCLLIQNTHRGSDLDVDVRRAAVNGDLENLIEDHGEEDTGSLPLGEGRPGQV